MTERRPTAPPPSLPARQTRRPTRAALAALAAAATLGAGTAAAAPFAIESQQQPFREFVPSGDSVTLRVTGPSSAALRAASIRRDGVDVTAAFVPDGDGVLVGTVSGLQPGANRIEVYPTRRAAAPLAGVTVSAGIDPLLACAGLTALTVPPELRDDPNDVIELTLAEAVAATPSLPEHCRIRGRINPRIGVNDTPFAIGFELRMPARWSGRFFFQGGGGNDGNIGNATGNTSFSGQPALARGFAAVSTDGGHTGGQASGFGFDPQARIDHAYNAYGKTAATAKAILDLYYGRVPQKSYFVGCSGGGRQGMMFTQRYPDAFDGVVAIAPAMRVATGASISAAWESITYRDAAPRNPDGAPILSQAFSNADLQLVSSAVLAQCDALDGLADGMIFNHRNCRFDPAVLECRDGNAGACLRSEQVQALKRGLGGPVDSSGRALYHPWPIDAGISAPGWRSWKLGTSATPTPNSAFVTLIQDAIRWEFLTPHDPTFDIFGFDFDNDPARLAAFGALYDTADDVDLAAFRSRGGKLMLFNGMSDAIFSPLETIDYMDRASRLHGTLRAAEFMRLFLIPGMTHCAGGPATDRLDSLSPLIDWVENGKAPQRLVATGASFPGQSRPLCPHPRYAQYTGSGDPAQAANHACVLPRR